MQNISWSNVFGKFFLIVYQGTQNLKSYILGSTQINRLIKFLRKLLDSVSCNNSLIVNAISIFGIGFWPKPKITGFSHWLKLVGPVFSVPYLVSWNIGDSGYSRSFPMKAQVCSQIVELISKWFKLPSNYCTQNGTN